MNNEQAFLSWAPEQARWSTWAKPVLFAHLDQALLDERLELPALDLEWCPAASERIALVIDLPGALGATLGVPLARRGYRPVPLYNAIPFPSGGIPAHLSTCAVDVIPILVALAQSAQDLATLELASDAPPAFLLDADRHGRIVDEGDFDNRSVSFSTDFPSANFLLAHGIGGVILVEEQNYGPQEDLAHTLRAFQDGGLPLRRVAVNGSGPPEPFTVSRPSWYRSMFQRALARLGLRRARDGGFGARVTSAAGG